LVALLATPPLLPASAQHPAGTRRPSKAELAARVDSVVQIDVLAQGMPSVSVVVTRGREMLLQRAWGIADIGSGGTALPSTMYQVGSLTKQFTAGLILKLVDRGTLSLTDSIGRYLTGLRPEMRAIRVEQLLNHTSGLRGDFRHGVPRTEPIARDSLFALANRDTLAASPGTKYLYSNTGYMLLGRLIEQRYGKSYADALRDETHGHSRSPPSRFAIRQGRV
jgi:CubicO group peptidase (beta-lactamase class C family)